MYRIALFYYILNLAGSHNIYRRFHSLRCLFVCGWPCRDSIGFCSDRGLSTLLFRRAHSQLLSPALRLQLRLNRSPAYQSVTHDDHLWHGRHVLSRHVQLSNSGSEHAYSQSWSSKKEGPDSFRFFK